MSHPGQFPPIPCFAFSEGSALLTASQLSEAVISPKKEKESSFKLRRRNPSTTLERNPRLGDPNFSSTPFVSAIVGTRENMDTWLRESGPGSSCLWIHVEDFSFESRRKTLSGKLKLSYRLRSEQGLSLPLLGETLIELSPVAPREEFKRVTKKSVYEILHPEESYVVSLRIKSGFGKSARAADSNQPVNFVTSDKAYKQLLQMVSPGGVLREYQSLLRRTAESSSFIDVDFQLVDLHKWLKQHPFAIFWEDNDIVIVRREADNLKWTLLRFDFSGGLIRSTQGTSLCHLESTFGTKTIGNIYKSEKNWRGDQVAYDAMWKARERELEDIKSKLEWKSWNNISSGQSCTSISPLNLVLIDILGSSATVSAAEIESVKLLFNSDPVASFAQAQEEATGPSVIQTTFTCPGRKRLSAKEKHALANLRSDNKDVATEGVCTLLDLLLKTGEETASKTCSGAYTISRSPLSPSNPDACSTSSSVEWLHSDQEDAESVFNTEAKPEENKYGDAVEINSDSDKVGDKHKARGNLPLKKDEATDEVGVTQLTEWVKCGFIDFLVEKLVVPRRGLQQQESKTEEKFLQCSFDRVVDACMKVMELLPREGTLCMVNIILGLLRELLETTGKLKSTDESRKVDEKLPSNKSSSDSSFRSSMKSEPDSQENKLQNTFAMAVRFSKFLSGLLTRSSILPGILTIAGGLELILDFYSCLLKRFPINLRLGAKSVDSDYCGGLLPGEALKSQVAPLKVLPCILPSLCICEFSQLCVIDCCIYPLEEKGDLTWIARAGDSSSCLFKQSEKLADGTCHDLIERLLTLTSDSRCEVSGDCVLASKGNQEPKFLNCNVEEKMFGAPPDIAENTDSDNNQRHTRRPYVPRLPLDSMPGSNMKSAANVISEGFEEPNCASLVCMGESMSSETSSTSPQFDVLKALSDIKYELLRNIATLFSTRSLSFTRIRGYLHQRLQDNEEDTKLVLTFLPDMIGGFVSTAPEFNGQKMKKILLQVVSLLDKSECCGNDRASNGINLHRQEEDTGFRWSGPGPLPATPKNCRRAIDVLLLKIGGRLTTLVNNLTTALTISEAYEKDAAISKQTWLAAGAERCCEASVVTKLFYSGHMLSLWVDVGVVLKFLGDFVLLWPEGGSARLMLKFCGKTIERVLDFLTKSLFDQSGWNLSQILVMQNLIRLSTACMRSTAQEKGTTSPQIWNEIDEFFWQLFIVSDSNWTIVKNFADWVLQRSCQGCMKLLVLGYHRMLWEPLEIYHSILGQKVSPPWARKNSEDCSPRRETLRKSILPFLRTSVLLIKKKLKCQSESSSQTPSVMYMSRLIFLLDFLMNPVDGLLMTVINAPVTSDEMNRLQKENGAKHESVPFNWNSKSDSMQPGIKESKNADVMGGRCTKCGISSTSETLTPSMRHECIAILADIFSLKASQFQDDQTNLCLNPRAQNPFLFRKYVNPFLEIISLCFLKCYNSKSQQKERDQLQLLCFTSPSRPHRNNCILKRNEHVDSSTEGSLDGRNEFVACTTDSRNDEEAASVACIQYARILLTLAQNQTEDVSRSFQQVRIMEFLVQQIALEYEVSQIATPRETVVQAAGSSSGGTPLSGSEKLVKIQDLNHDHPEGKAHRPVHISRRDEMRSSSKDLSTIIEGESIHRELSGNLEADPRVTYNRVCISYRSQAGARRYQTSRRTTDEQTLNHRCCFKTASCCLGFHSARDTGFVNSGKHQPYWLLLDQPLLKSHHSNVTCQLSEEVAQNLLPFGERNRNTLNPVLLSERGTTSTWTLSQRGRRVSAIFNGNLLGIKSQNYNSPKLPAGNMRDSVQVKVSLGCSPTAEVQRTAPTDNQRTAAPVEDEKRNIASSLTQVKYSGRFFDLNEEVERELEKEDYSPVSLDHITDRTESSSNDSEQLVVDSNNLQREVAVGFSSDMQGTSLSGSSSSRQQPNATTCSKRHAEDVGITGKGLAIPRPAIPRLKLPKSVRKGGQDVISDTSMNLEFLLSTTSTQESNGRLNSLLELQKEFASDRDDHDGSWMLGSYETKRLRRMLYRHAGLHVLLLELYIALMLNTQGSLEACYSDRFPMENRKINAPFFLSYHLNHPANSYLLPCLSKRMKEFKPAAYRILKLTWRALFTPLLYRNRIRIAHGAFAQVYTATVRGQTVVGDDHHVVLKVIDVPKGPYDPCKFFDVFSEVEILEKFAGDPRVCQILDYGVEAESFVLVLKHYKCSLRTWRERHNNASTNWDRRLQSLPGVKLLQQSFHKTLPLYLEVYSAVIQAVKVLAAENVVHYDLKCDNILLEPVDPSHPESEFWTPVWPPVNTTNPLPFRVCVADFGQSKASTYLGGECTVRNRGTEYVKSPEMLKLLSSKPQPQNSESNNIRQVEGAVGKAVDVWSLGCLLYELLTGEYLLYDDDWLRFFIRVTVPSEELIPQDKAAKLDNYGPVLDLLQFILVRDPLQRPTLDDVITCVEQLQLKIQQQPVPEAGSSFSDSTLNGVMYAISDDEETGSESSSSESDAGSLERVEVVKTADDEMPKQGGSLSKFESEVMITQPDVVLEPAETSKEGESSDVFGPDLAIPKQGHAFSDCFACLNCLLCGCLCSLE